MKAILVMRPEAPANLLDGLRPQSSNRTARAYTSRYGVRFHKRHIVTSLLAIGSMAMLVAFVSMGVSSSDSIASERHPADWVGIPAIDIPSDPATSTIEDGAEGSGVAPIEGAVNTCDDGTIDPASWKTDAPTSGY